HPSDISFERRC
ncbi:hypothetical protein J007_05966, partial [Cryptococcus neoformans]